MSLSDESAFDSGLGRFAPSRLFCSLPNGSGDNCREGRSFEETFKTRTWENAENALFHNYAVVPSGDDSAADSPAFTSATTLGDTRGKIILLRRFDSGQDLGFDLTYWPEKRRFSSASLPVHHVEDQYRNPGDDDKFDLVVTHVEEARKGDPEDLYITFSSAVDLAARGYSKSINPRLSDYLAETPEGASGSSRWTTSKSPGNWCPM